MLECMTINVFKLKGIWIPDDIQSQRLLNDLGIEEETTALGGFSDYNQLLDDVSRHGCCLKVAKEC